MPKSRWGVVAIVAANLFPVLGALLWDWTLFDVLALYWAESGVIGLFNVLKMVRIDTKLGLGLGLFFAAHFGVFMAVHGVFLVVLFSPGGLAGGGEGDLADVFRVIGPALLPLAACHGYSFVAGFLRGREYEGRTVEKQMMEPYKRIVLMHLVILLGGLPVALLGAGGWALVLLVTAKSAIEIRSIA